EIARRSSTGASTRTLFGRKPQCPHGIHPNGRFVVVRLLERDVPLSGLVDAIGVEQLLYPVGLARLHHQVRKALDDSPWHIDGASEKNVTGKSKDFGVETLLAKCWNVRKLPVPRRRLHGDCFPGSGFQRVDGVGVAA